MNFRCLLVSLLFPLLGYTQSVTVGAGTNFTNTNVYGPMTSTNQFDTSYSRHAYIYPSSVLGGLLHGDTIRTMEFLAQDDNNLNMSGSVNLKIYLKMVKEDSFPAGSLNWTKESKSGAILVYDGNPANLMDGTNEYKNFVFNVNYFRFDTSGGKKNLEVLFAYDQWSRQASATFWVYETSFSVSNFKSFNEGKIAYGNGKAPDTTRFSDRTKPHIRINFPRYSQNLGILMTYALGKVPLLAGVKDSIKVLVLNRGKNLITNHTVYLTISGANKHKDSVMLTNVYPWEKRIVGFGQYKPDSSGTDILNIDLSKDDESSDNADTVERLVNYNVFTHTNPFQGNAGGIGFNGETGDFVAKFYSDTGVYINQVAVDFSSNGRGFRVGIWDDKGSGGMPGKVLFMSDSLSSKGGTYILPVIPKVKVGGGFYVGIRQNTRTNVGFSFQYEDPIRPNTFYFTAPMGNTSWVPFTLGYPFKFNIQPRIQVADDVAPIAITFPAANQNIEYNVRDSIGPIASITNYGFNDQTTPFEVVCTITSFAGAEEYKSTKKITLLAGQTKNVYFDTTFRLYYLGNHKIKVTTNLAKDKVVDNNSMEQVFTISIKHDIGADIMYTPEEGFTYEYKRDTIVPTVRINNFGTVDKNNFKVTFRIRNGSNVIHSETLTRSLAAGKQEIVSFSKIVPKTIGDYIAECFTSYKDSIPFNDTIRHNIVFQKSNDVAPKSIDVPGLTNIYTMGGFFFPKLTVINYGVKTQDTAFKILMYVYDTKGKLFFTDSSTTTLGGFTETQVNFKRVNIPMEFGKYKVFFKTALKLDQEPSNDTLTGFFTVIPNKDIGPLSIVLPAKDTVLSIESLPIRPSIKIKNFGSLTQNNAGPIIIKIFNKNLLVFADSAFSSGNISYNSQLNITFPGNFNTAETGEFTVQLFTRLTGDLVPANDTLNSRFRITRNYDLALDTNGNIPRNHIFIYENTYHKPQILVKNFGSIAYKQPYLVSMYLYKNNQLEKSLTRSFDSLPRFASHSFFQDSLINLRQTGDFKFCVAVKGGLDQNQSNDSFCWNFKIVKPFDLAIDSFVIMDKNGNCYHNITYQPVLKASNLGSSDVSSAPIQLRIYKNSSVYWESNRMVSLAPNESAIVKFDSTLTFNFEGIAWARAIGNLFGDNEKSNDTLVTFFNVQKTSALDRQTLNYFKVFPNPTDGEIFITMSQGIGAELSVYDLSGKIRFTKYLDKNVTSYAMNLKTEANLRRGVYFIRLKNANVYKSFKLVIL